MSHFQYDRLGFKVKFSSQKILSQYTCHFTRHNLFTFCSIFYMRTWFRMILDVPLPPEKTKSEPMTTPRFLFRVWSPNSDGKNSAKGFESLGRVTNSGRPRRLTDLRTEVVKQMVTHHVAWTSKWAYYDDILISFTSSLLFAIQHAIRKTNTSPPGYLPDTPDTCFLTIIDTTSLKQTFHKTRALVDQYKITDMDWADRQISFQRPQHEHEYLAEWSVNLRAAPNCSCTVNFGLLMKKGIDKVVPQFDVKYQKQLGMHVSLIRFLNHVRGQRYAVAASISFEELTAIYDLTACFSGRWQRLMRVWFMAMSQRKVDDQAVRDLLNRSWSADENIFDGYNQVFIPEPTVVIEEREFMKLMTLGAAIAYQRNSPDDSLPYWSPKPKSTPVHLSEQEAEGLVPPLGVVPLAIVVEPHKAVKAIRNNCNSIEEIWREMDGPATERI